LPGRGILERVWSLSGQEVLAIAGRGYPDQFVDGMQVLHPGKKLVGRAVRRQLMPLRADDAAVRAEERKAMGGAPLPHETAIDTLQPGDVFVVDAFGSIPSGVIIATNWPCGFHPGPPGEGHVNRRSTGR
jgi:4-hydroxy-4-methyl-2-oxoglutarate aldolase